MPENSYPQDSFPANALVVDYLVDGPRNAAGVYSGRCTLRGMAVVDQNGNPEFFAENLVGALSSQGTTHRIYHDALFARAIETRHGLPPPATFDGLRIMGHLLDENLSCEFGDLQARWFAETRTSSTTGTVQPAVSTPAMSAELLRRIMVDCRPLDQIAGQGLDFIYEHVELPLVEPVRAMLEHGVPIHLDLMQQIQASHQTQLEIARYRVSEIAGRELNVDSYPELSSFLFQELRLPAGLFTENGNPSTGEMALQALEHQHPVIAPIRAYRAAKIVADAAEAILRNITGGDALVVGRLDPQGAATGRFSCSEPNLQALPPELLSAIVARRGYRLLEADFSQIELRVLAQLSQDAALLEAFHHDVDVHARTASMIYGISERIVSHDQRQVGKSVNFGIIFGQTPWGLARALQIGEQEAAAAIESFFHGYAQVRPWIEQVESFAAAHGYVLTHYCRRRRLASRLNNPNETRAALREAVNAVIQGTAADIVKMAVARVHQALPASCRLLLCVHDSVLIEVPEAETEAVGFLVREAMELAPLDFTLPLKVSVHTGKTWADCKAASR